MLQDVWPLELEILRHLIPDLCDKETLGRPFLILRDWKGGHRFADRKFSSSSSFGI